VFKKKRARCHICGKPNISETLGYCVDCIRDDANQTVPKILKVHEEIRRQHRLPITPPKACEGIQCNNCSNECIMGTGEKGYCGLRQNNGYLRSKTKGEYGLLHAYLDPHITNCCSAWFCSASTGKGYPKYAYCDDPEFGYNNLAIFMYGCNFNCLYCQNESHKDFNHINPTSAESIIQRISRNPKISCICFFGGSPEPQLDYTLKLGDKVLQVKDRILRICYEWNGCGDPQMVRRAANQAYKSGGTIKFDLKAFTPSLSLALSGVNNKRAYENFSLIAEKYEQKETDMPLLSATTLLVPEYVDKNEVDKIANFIKEQNKAIHYSLLVFHPAYKMRDLPRTPLKQVMECYRTAKKHLKNVHVGNLHLLGLRNLKELERLN
jgi:pyruvate formate lyase activating enzyme